MLALTLGMLVCTALAVAVVGVVAIPARREGRGLLVGGAVPPSHESATTVEAGSASTTSTTSAAAGDAPAGESAVTVAHSAR